MTNTRQQRRALERYAYGVECATESDRRWFEEHPHRAFRVRRMAAAEIGSATAALGTLKPAPAGYARFTLVRKVSPNLRVRAFIFGPADKSGQEASEEAAAELWRQRLDRNPEARSHELAVAAIVSDHDGSDPTFGEAPRA